MMVSAIIASVVSLPLALLIAVGKGDALIAGYNTATDKERACYRVERLRGVIAVFLLLVAGVFWLPVIVGKELFVLSVLLMTVSTLVTVILANTWAKK